jgi:O-antigen/teichoic acid export membrane protein
VLTSLSATQEALLVREMAFRKLELCTMAATIAGGVAGIVIAAAGGGAWAIVVQQLGTAGSTTALLWWASPWRPRFLYALASLRSLGGFSLNVFGQRVLYYLHRNVDNLLIGRFLGAAALGVYAFAYNVMLVPFSRIAGPLQQVLFPAFARVQDDPERIASMWVRGTRLTAAISIPSLVGIAVVAPEFVAAVLGDRWSAAVPVLQVLAWVGLLQSLQGLNTAILTAIDRTSTLVRYSVVFLGAHLLAFTVGLHWGIVGVAVCYAISTSLVEPLYAWLTARALGVSPFLLVRAVGGIAQAAVGMAAGVLAAQLVLVHAGVGAGPRLAVEIAVGIAVFLPLCTWRAPEVNAELRRLTGRGRPAPLLLEEPV